MTALASISFFEYVALIFVIALYVKFIAGLKSAWYKFKNSQRV